MKKTILYFFLIAPAMAGAQNILTQNTDWSTSKTFEISTGKMSLEPNKVVTYKSDKIEWLDVRGTLKLSLPIKSTTGSWADIKSAGEMVYQVQVGTGAKVKVGTVTIRKNGTGTTIKFVLPGEQGSPVFWELTVESTKTR